MKYLEGNIFVNFYIFGAAGIIAVLLGGVFFSWYGLKKSFIISFWMSIIGNVGILVIQSKCISFSDQAKRD